MRIRPSTVYGSLVHSSAYVWDDQARAIKHNKSDSLSIDIFVAVFRFTGSFPRVLLGALKQSGFETVFLPNPRIWDPP